MKCILGISKSSEFEKEKIKGVIKKRLEIRIFINLFRNFMMSLF